ncbi:urea ABC transporter ATP-binding subunit UrtE [soil metagenome]
MADVQVGYGRSLVLFGVSVEAPEGQVTCVMGRNGVGKTTLLNAMMGLLPVRSGRVAFGEHDVTRMAPHRRARLGVAYVPQGHQVFPLLSVRENLQVIYERTHALPARRGNGFSAALEAPFELFPALPPLLDRPSGLLSGGQAQQLAIARALITEPHTLVLDEPTEGIQPSIVEEIEAAIARLHRSTGMTILLVEQYVDMALRLSDRYVVMDHGEVVDAGDTETVDHEDFASLIAI